MYGPSYVFRGVFRSVWMVSHNAYLNANIARVRPGEQTTWERWHDIEAVQDQFWYGFDEWGRNTSGSTQVWGEDSQAWEATQVAWEPQEEEPWETTQRDNSFAWESTQEQHDAGAPHPPLYGK